MGHYGKALLDVQSGLALKTTPELYALGGRILYLQGVCANIVHWTDSDCCKKFC